MGGGGRGGGTHPFTLPLDPPLDLILVTLYHGMLKSKVFMDWSRMYIEMGLTTDLLLTNYMYNPFEISFK